MTLCTHMCTCLHTCPHVSVFMCSVFLFRALPGYLSQPFSPTFPSSFANSSHFHIMNIFVFFSQDISPLLASIFEDLYTGDVFGEDLETNWIKSQGGDNVYHESFTEELQKLLDEYNCRLREADRAEENIIQAQERAKAEEERVLNELKADVGEDFHKMGLPPVASCFRWIVDNELLRKNNLICPEDYITDKSPPTRAPKGKSEPGYVKETFAFKQRVSSRLRDKMPAEIKLAGKDSTCKAERESERAYLARLEKRQNYLKNPRFFPPNSLHGGKSLVISQGKVEKNTARRKEEDEKGYAVYTMTVELQNITSTCHYVRLIPPSTSAFAIGPGKFPGKGGLIAPGMTCQYTVRFTPKYPGDYEDCMLVETQVSEPLFIPIQAKRPPPVLTLPHIIDCGPCLVGGIKVMTILCRNEGIRTEKFSIMPKKACPSPNFGAIATDGFVIQAPFGIHPPVLELASGQNTTIEVSTTCYRNYFHMVNTNTYFFLQGVGQLIALELLFVTGGESKPKADEATDATAQHLIQFDPQNPHTSKEKKLVIRNSTQVELPFYLQIMKPNLKPLVPEETTDFTKVKYDQDTESAFFLDPEEGVLLPCTDHEFILTYTPWELKSYHSVIQMVLVDIPEFLVKDEMLQNIPEYKTKDVTALGIEVKGLTEAFNLLLEPYAIIIPGENFIGVNIRKTFKMWNNSKSLIKYTWEKIVSRDIMVVEPCTGIIDVNKCCKFELLITGSKPGSISYNLQCKIESCTEPVVLHVEAAFKGPLLHIDVPSLQLGLIKQGENVLQTFKIQNLCQLPAQWSMQESKVCLAERNEKVSPFTIQPSAGEIPPLGVCTVSVQFTSLRCQRLHTVLELEVEDGEGSHLPVFVEVQAPQACLISSHLIFTEIYTGVPARATSKLFNQRLLPAKYLWGKLIGSQAAFCSATVSPASGTLGPNEEKEFCIELSANILGELKDLALSCSIEDMMEPLLLSISGEVKGLHVTYAVPSDCGVASDERQMPQSPCDLLLDFGSEVAFKAIVKRQLILTNHTGISAPFKLEAEYFTGYSLTPEQGICPHQMLLCYAPSEFAAALLSHGKGVAFHIQPSTGTLKAFQQLIIEITAYNNMWGEYQDDLVCKVSGASVLSEESLWHIFTPILFSRFLSVSPLRFGTHISGGSPVFRRVQLNNPTPLVRMTFAQQPLTPRGYIRLDWEVYNREQDDNKLVDQLMFFEDPFPLKNTDENETGSIGSTSESEIVLKLDQSAVPRPTVQKLVSVLIRPHEGVPADSPYSITPRQIVVPGGGSISVCISFTPSLLPETATEVRCEGFLLGFMSLDDKAVPNKVHRKHRYEVPQLRVDLQAFVRHALQTSTTLSRELKLTSSDSFLHQVLTNSVMTQSLKLINYTKVPLYFRLLLSTPFSLSSTDAPKSTKTSHSKREEEGQQPQLVLYPQQNMLVKVSFHTTLELLMYQHLPDTQLLPGFQVLQSENGERKLKFNQNLVIEYSNCTTQLVPVTAYLTVPVLKFSCHTVHFKSCFVGQTKIEHVFLCNRSGSRSYWTALLGILHL
uniref:DLEC1 cilia and flagella associated protein n=1 Tax=Melopsittacus undulatus TaxID=13146 RepID=A0A8C6IWU7_MELUD